MRRATRNFGLIVSANSLAAVLGACALILNAWALGPQLLGFLMLFQSATTTIERVVTADSYKALIRYCAGLDLRAPDGIRCMTSRMWAASGLDMLGAVAAGITGSAILTMLDYFGILSDFEVNTCWVFSLSLFFRCSGSAVGCLRVLDKYKIVGIAVVAESAVKVALYVALWLLGAGLIWYGLATCGAAVARHVFLHFIAWRHLRGMGVSEMDLTSVGSDMRLLWRFSWVTSIGNALSVVRQQADVIICGILLGAEATGIYCVAQRPSTLLVAVATPLSHAIYPEMVRLAASGRRPAFVRHVYYPFFIGASISIIGFAISAIYGDWLLSLAFGSEFSHGAMPMAILIASQGIYLSAIGFSCAQMAVGKPATQVAAVLAGLTAYVLSLIMSANNITMASFAIAQLCFFIVWAAWTSLNARIAFSRHFTSRDQHAGEAAISGGSL